jgi:uncharacterized protein with WD repeat
MPHLIPGQTMFSSAHIIHPIFSPDSRWVAASITNGDAQIVDPTTPDWAVHRVLAHAGFPVTFSSDAATLLTFTSDPNTLRRWNVNSGKLLSTTAVNSAISQWRAYAASLDGNRLALAGNDNIEVFETRNCRCVTNLVSPGAESMEFSPDGQWLAVAAYQNCDVWDVAAGRLMWRFSGYRDRVVSIKFSPDQKILATTSWDHTVRVWDAATGRPLSILTNHKAAAMTCAFSPDGRTLITGSNDHTIKFWNLATLREVFSIQLDDPVAFLTLSPDGKIMAANYADLGMRCWHVPSLAEIDAAEASEKVDTKP